MFIVQRLFLLNDPNVLRVMVILSGKKYIFQENATNMLE